MARTLPQRPLFARLRTPSLAVVLLSALLFSASGRPAMAAGPHGLLDPSFGLGGKVLTEFSGSGSSDDAQDLAIQSDGKLVAAGSSCCSSGGQDFALARYTVSPPGGLDSSFGSAGKVTTDFGGFNDGAFALAIQADGKLVATGVSDAGGSYDFALARYNTNGTLDLSFGSAGKVTTDISGSGSTDQALAVAIQPDGKILAVGESATGICCTNEEFALARYNPDGSPDPTFGAGGIVLTDFSGSGSNDLAKAVALQSDGKILAAGSSDAAGYDDFALARYNVDGSLDPSFGSAGKVTTDLIGQDVIYALVVQSDGKIAAGGFASASDFALARYNVDGSLDVNFGSGGTATSDFSGSGSFEIALGLAIQSDGKLVAAGVSDASGTYDFALARYTPDGKLDRSFGSGGKVLTDFSGSGSFDWGSSLVIQSDGKIVAAGNSDANGTPDFALARYSR